MNATTDFLARMGESSQRRCDAARQAASTAELRARIRDLPAPPRLDRDRFALFAEIKLAAPSRPDPARAPRIDDRVAAYTAGGAAAISVLTEPDHFAGSLAHLRAAATCAGGVPVMRKDFIVDGYQLLEARAHGAGGALLIAELFDDDARLADTLATARDCGLFVLLEAFGPEQAERAARFAADDVLIGVNCRDLRDLSLDPGRFATCADTARAVGAIAESGMHGPEDVAMVAGLGYRGALVGSSLMASDDPTALAAALVGAGQGVSP